MAARQDRLAEAEQQRSAPSRTRPPNSARQAGTLKELIDRMEKDIAAARRAAEEAATGRGGPGEARRASDLPRPPSGIRPGSPRKSPSPRQAACCRGRSEAMSRANSGPRTAMAGRRAAFRSARGRPCRRGIPGGWVGGFRRPFPVVWATLDHQRGRRVLSLVSRHGPDQRRSRVSSCSPGSPSRPWARHPPCRRRRERSKRATPCSMLSSGKTAVRSIQGPGGRNRKAKRFAANAQTVPYSHRCRRRRRWRDARVADRICCPRPARWPPPPRPIASSACSATCSRRSARTTSRSRTRPS